MGVTLWQSMTDMTEKMMREAFDGIETLDDWQRVRPVCCHEFTRSLGLDPLPERCDLKLTDHGGFAGPGFRARRLSFQIMTDCWASAGIYYPDPAPSAPAPAVLYVCGHAAIGTLQYQAHPIMWARRGYVCLIVDTIEQNDNSGEHHGYSDTPGRDQRFCRNAYNEWLSLGYTSAGGEVWNAVRALDVLAADERVDSNRLAVTGVSGGGAVSFHLAILDERIRAVSTLCGVSTPYDAVANRHLISHCNCIYPNNVYRRDTSEYAALIAPRGLLFCFADNDALFNPESGRALVERTGKIFRLYGEPDRCALATCSGGHGDHPEFDAATSLFFDRYVSGHEQLPARREARRIVPERETTVFNGCPPEPNRLAWLPHLLTPRGSVGLPDGPGDWPVIRDTAVKAVPRLAGRDHETARMEPVGAWLTDSNALRQYRGTVAGMDIWMQTYVPSGSRPRLILGVAGQGETALDVCGRVISAIEPGAAGAGGFEPRLSSIHSLASESGAFPFKSKGAALGPEMLPFAFSLVGATPVMLTIQDVGIALDYLLGLEEMRGIEVFLYGRDDAGVAALYAALLDTRVAGVLIENPPASHLEGSPIMGILRAFDLPQALGLMAPRKVVLIRPGHGNLNWPARVFQRLGCPGHFARAYDLRKASSLMLAHPAAATP